MIKSLITHKPLSKQISCELQTSKHKALGQTSPVNQAVTLNQEDGKEQDTV